MCLQLCTRLQSTDPRSMANSSTRKHDRHLLPSESTWREQTLKTLKPKEKARMLQEAPFTEARGRPGKKCVSVAKKCYPGVARTPREWNPSLVSPHSCLMNQWNKSRPLGRSLTNWAGAHREPGSWGSDWAWLGRAGRSLWEESKAMREVVTLSEK